MELQCFSLMVQDKWALLEMARPEKLNVIDESMLSELDQIMDFLEEDSIKAVVLTGQGKAFAAGADVAAMAAMDEDAAQVFSRLGNKIFQRIEDHPSIFIAAVNGYALGGGLELALACDLRFASEKAVFGQPEINLGIIPGFGGTQRLPRILGAARAKEWILTGRRVSAQEALDAGLLSGIFAPDTLLVKARDLANEVSSKSAPILALAKAAINASGTGINPEHGQREAELFSKCFATKDGPEGLKAFVEKRRPVFIDG